ncbi:glycoside hydrolase family 27 protein [Streptomyces sp. CAI-85]|nr:glycoside hydrolase family 27 protein [Streptomyces sp. CAI-85]
MLSCLTALALWASGVATATAHTADTHSGDARTPDATAPSVVAVDDGQALTPPMGFNNWNSFGCNVTEQLIKQTADIFVSTGLRDAGYTYVNIDDCWMTRSRDSRGRLVADPAKFPSGMKATADYVHSKGLKFGIYQDGGSATCAGYPGSLGHETVDAQTFADWGVDLLKYDNCNNPDSGQAATIARYRTMRDALRATGRPIVFSICEWGSTRPWEWGAATGHMWRTTYDIRDNWPSMLNIAKQNLPLAAYAGPGRWNDPDMLEVGNGGMSDTEYRTHFSLWAMMAAPLIISTDLRRASAQTMQILLNKEIIAVDQDRLGRQGTVLSSSGGRWVIVKQLADGSRAVALFNETGQPQTIRTTAQAVQLPPAGAYTLRDLWQHTTSRTTGDISATVPAHGTVVYRVSPATGG